MEELMERLKELRNEKSDLRIKNATIISEAHTTTNDVKTYKILLVLAIA